MSTAELNQAIRDLTRARVTAGAKLSIIESVLADIFRVHLGLESATPDEVKDALGELSTKLLDMQQAAQDAKNQAGVMLADIQNAVSQVQASPPEAPAEDDPTCSGCADDLGQTGAPPDCDGCPQDDGPVLEIVPVSDPIDEVLDRESAAD